MINGRNFFDQPIKNELKTYDNIRKTAAGQNDNYKTGCFSDYPYFKEYYKLIAIELDADPKTIQQISFTRNLDETEDATIFFIIEEAKETILDFSKGAVKVLWFYFVLV